MQHCLGIVLSVLAFREKDQIATIFSERGLLKFYVRSRRSALMTSLTEGEFVFATGRSDLHQFRDGTIVNQHLRLRERFESLEAAGELVRAVVRTQWPGKEAPALFALFRYSLQKIPEVERPGDLATIFLVKTLKHEGVLQLLDHCSVCERPGYCRFGGERFCQKHAPVASLVFSPEEELRLIQMAEERNLQTLLASPLEMREQVATLFDQAFQS